MGSGRCRRLLIVVLWRSKGHYVDRGVIFYGQMGCKNDPDPWVLAEFGHLWSILPSRGPWIQGSIYWPPLTKSWPLGPIDDSDRGPRVLAILPGYGDHLLATGDHRSLVPVQDWPEPRVLALHVTFLGQLVHARLVPWVLDQTSLACTSWDQKVTCKAGPRARTLGFEVK